MAKPKQQQPARSGVKASSSLNKQTSNLAAQLDGDAADPVAFSVIRDAERDEIAERPPRPFFDREKTGKNWTGLCLSGGGIRSACFSLGVLEGLDRLPYTPDEQVGDEAGVASRHNHLEFFDYVSGVSGGSCAAGHLATAMLPRADEPSTPVEPQWLGDVPLASKTVPGWLWGLGVWFLGAVFQLLKTGSLLVGVLAVVALCMRVLDAPDAAFFCSAMGSDSDVTRGFVPFWITLWVFLVGYGFSVWKKGGWAVGWFLYAAALSAVYVLVVSWTHDDDPMNRWWLPFWFHYGALALLVLPGILICAGVLIWRGIVRLTGRLSPRYSLRLGLWRARLARRLGVQAARLSRRPGLGSRTGAPRGGRARAPVDQTPFRLRTALLGPLLVGLFCFAGLVTTGDIEFSSLGDDPTELLASQHKSQQYSELGDWIYSAAWVALGLASLGFVFPRNLFQSVRRIEEHDAAGRKQEGSWFKSRGWEPVFRVVVFLCGYGVVLLVLFLVFSTVAKENVSGYYDWRKDLPSAAFHFTDFRDPELAWGKSPTTRRHPRKTRSSRRTPGPRWRAG